MWYHWFSKGKIEIRGNFLNSEKLHEFATMIPNLVEMYWDWKLKKFMSVLNGITFITSKELFARVRLPVLYT